MSSVGVVGPKCGCHVRSGCIYGLNWCVYGLNGRCMDSVCLACPQLVWRGLSVCGMVSVGLIGCGMASVGAAWPQ